MIYFWYYWYIILKSVLNLLDATPLKDAYRVSFISVIWGVCV